MSDEHSHRRRFLKTSSAVSAAIVSTAGIPQPAPAQEKLQPSVDTFIAGKDKRLIVHSHKIGEIETPLELLREHRITPEEILFVRNNQLPAGAMTLEPLEDPHWKIEIFQADASCENFLIHGVPSVSITLAELLKLETVEREFVLQCSGNDRSRYARAAKVEGVPWGSGAVGNVRMKGVMLKTVFEKLEMTPHKCYNFITVEGHDVPDGPQKPDFEHSIPLADALERSFLATHLNGKPLPRVHGGPVRFITLGYYGTMNVKWVSRLRLEESETTNYNHAVRYRTPLKPIQPGEKFSATLANSEPNWNMKIKSTIFAPLAGEKVSSAKPVEISGVAWNDGQAKIVAVEISTDGMKSWQRAELTSPTDPYAWYTWKTTAKLSAGKQTIYSRAHDALGRSQPLDGAIHWNSPGYAWNGVGEVEVEVG
jgi:sulfite oxidase